MMTFFNTNTLSGTHICMQINTNHTTGSFTYDNSSSG